VNTKRLELRDYYLEFIVGSFFCIAVGILSYFTIIIGQSSFSDNSYPLKVIFNDVSNLEKGNNVLLRGMIVGTVSKLEMDTKGVIVTLSVDDKVTILNGYDIKVESSSVLGGTAVFITQGKIGAAEVAKDELLIGSATPNILTEAASILAKLKKEGLFEKISTVASDLASMTANIKSGKGTLGKLITEDSLYSETRELVASVTQAGKDVSHAATEVKVTIGNIKQDMQTTIKNIEKFSHELADSNSTIAKLFSDDGELYNKLDKTMSELTKASEKLNNGDGTLAKLINDPALYTEAQSMVSDVRAAVQEVSGVLQDIRESSAISTFGSFVFGAL
jgi:phospholipid/cholesterol/gamma-HCH transport system substrate-binding protein